MKTKYCLRFVLVLGIALLGFTSGKYKKAAPELSWTSDLNVAHERSQKTGKPIFGFFTGSDWCGWCMKLQRDVFAKDAFKEWADKNVILLELDFPRRKVLPASLQEQNSGLQQAFQVRGYPTVWLFKADKDTSNHYNLNAYGSLGYPTGATPGQEEVMFIKTANDILGKK